MSKEPAEAVPLIIRSFAPTHLGTVRTARSWKASTRSHHLLSVVTCRHTPAAPMRWTEGRAAPSVTRFPEEPGEKASGAHQWVPRHAGATI
jgi:hypothetical protein